MRIICDMDEVLAQFVERILTRWNKDKKTNFQRSEINMWAMEKTLGPGSYGEIERWISEPGFFESLKPVDGAIEGFNRLLANGHEVVVATMLAEPVLNGYDGKRLWMRKHFPKFDMKNFICTSRKNLIRADAIIDDSSQHINDWVNTGGKTAIVFDAPWNQDIPEGRAFRAKNWDMVTGYISTVNAFSQYINDYARKKIG